MRGRGVAMVAGMRMGERRAQEAAAQQQQQAAQQQQAPPPAAAPAPASTDVTAELQKLAALHDSGVLSDEEFAASKKKLLGI